MRQYTRNGETVNAVRYEPDGPNRALNHLANAGVGCLHLNPTNASIQAFSYLGEITIDDPRHDYDRAEATIYPGDWLVWHNPWHIEIVPSAVFDANYIQLAI